MAVSETYNVLRAYNITTKHFSIKEQVNNVKIDFTTTKSIFTDWINDAKGSNPGVPFSTIGGVQYYICNVSGYLKICTTAAGTDGWDVYLPDESAKVSATRLITGNEWIYASPKPKFYFSGAEGIETYEIGSYTNFFQWYDTPSVKPTYKGLAVSRTFSTPAFAVGNSSLGRSIYQDAAFTTPVALTDPLVDGKTYYISDGIFTIYDDNEGHTQAYQKDRNRTTWEFWLDEDRYFNGYLIVSNTVDNLVYVQTSATLSECPHLILEGVDVHPSDTIVVGVTYWLQSAAMTISIRWEDTGKVQSYSTTQATFGNWIEGDSPYFDGTSYGAENWPIKKNDYAIGVVSIGGRVLHNNAGALSQDEDQVRASDALQNGKTYYFHF